MIIGIDASRAVLPNPTGTERYAREIIRHLLALPQANGHRWRLYINDAYGAHRDFIVTDSAPTLNAEFRSLPGRRLWTHRVLAREVTRRPPDVLFVPSHVIPFVLPSRRLPPSVVTIHDLGYHHFPQAHTRFQRLYLTWSTRWSARVAQRIIAISQMTATDLHNRYATPAAKVRVVYEAGKSLAQPDGNAISAVRNRYGLNRPYALYVGTIQPRKNLLRLVHAYAQLAIQHELNWDLVLAGGSGWLQEPIHEEILKLGLPDHIHITGYVPDRDLSALLRDASFLAFPSLYEGFGLPILEAQQLGVPVMSSNTSAIPEVAGDAAILVDPMDVDAIAQAMLRLSEDETLRQRVIQAGYENVKRFSWEKAARETLAVLEEAAAAKGK